MWTDSRIKLIKEQFIAAAVPTEQGDVNLAPLDVLLDQRWLPVAGQHERDLPFQRGAIVDHRIGRDADRGILARRLDDERKGERDPRDVRRC